MACAFAADEVLHLWSTGASDRGAFVGGEASETLTISMEVEELHLFVEEKTNGHPRTVPSTSGFKECV